MGTFGELGALVMLGILTLGLGTLAWMTYGKEKRAQDEPVTLSAQAGHIFEQYADMTARVSALEAEVKSLTRKQNDLDDSVEHRFRRLNARAKREEPVAEPEEERTLTLPFPPPNGAAGPSRPRNGAFPRPFGPFRG